MNKVNTMKFILNIIQGGRPVGKTYREYLQNQSLQKLIEIAKNENIKYYKNHNGRGVILKRETLIKKLCMI
jgi:hypothetical protein